VGKGRWRTGPIELFSHTTLDLEEGAILSFIPEPERYPPVRTRWEGVECFALHPLVFARDGEDITLTGKGTLDGGGLPWWEMVRAKRQRGQAGPETPGEQELARLNGDFRSQPGGGGGRAMQFLRPPLVQFYRCRGICMEGLSLKDSPFWTVHPVFCQDLVLRDLRITNPPKAPNTDGIDIDSCAQVLVEGCSVSVGDDGIAVKSGSGEDGRRVGIPSVSVTVRDCVVEAAHGGIVIGSETAGGVQGVRADHCRFIGTDRGVRIKTRRGRGGEVRDLEFRDIVMEENLCPLAINMYYRCGAENESRNPEGPFSQEALPVNEGTPSIRNILVESCRAWNCRASAGFVAGLPESPVENLTIRDCVFSTREEDATSPSESDMFLGVPEVREKSLRFLHVKNLSLEQVTVDGPSEPFLYR